VCMSQCGLMCILLFVLPQPKTSSAIHYHKSCSKPIQQWFGFPFWLLHFALKEMSWLDFILYQKLQDTHETQVHSKFTHSI
jgi:hypothetical protein